MNVLITHRNDLSEEIKSSMGLFTNIELSHRTFQEEIKYNFLHQIHLLLNSIKHTGRCGGGFYVKYDLM